MGFDLCCLWRCGGWAENGGGGGGLQLGLENRVPDQPRGWENQGLNHRIVPASRTKIQSVQTYTEGKSIHVELSTFD